MPFSRSESPPDQVLCPQSLSVIECGRGFLKQSKSRGPEYLWIEMVTSANLAKTYITAAPIEEAHVQSTNGHFDLRASVRWRTAGGIFRPHPSTCFIDPISLRQFGSGKRAFNIAAGGLFRPYVSIRLMQMGVRATVRWRTSGGLFRPYLKECGWAFPTSSIHLLYRSCKAATNLLDSV